MAAQTAYRVHVLRLAMGIEEDPSILAEVGGILETDMALDLRAIRDMYAQVHKE